MTRSLLFALCPALGALSSCSSEQISLGRADGGIAIADAATTTTDGVGWEAGVGTQGGGGASDAGKGLDGGAPDGTSDVGGKEGGAGGASDASDAADGGPPSSLCPFASGLNVAWVKFADDVPNPDMVAFNTIFKNTHDAGGRVIRWWFHTNGSTTPGYDANGQALPIAQSHIDGVKNILNAASANQVEIIITLWSFDMLQANAGAAHVNNALLLEDDVHRQAYVDNYLTPLVRAVKDTPGLYAWDIFNEPEGMGPNGWATYRTTMAAIQRTVNWLAAAIRAADPNARITNSAQTFASCSNVAGKTNYYSDSALKAAGGKENGTIDFYQVHYYAVNGASNSPFLRPASYWALDKKVVLGEFAAIDNDGVAQLSLYTYLYDNGYAGAWAWAYNADWPWPSMQAPMENVYRAHPSEVGCPAASEMPAQRWVGSSPRGAHENGTTVGDGTDAAARESSVIRALAARGAMSAARARAEQVVNEYPDSAWVREIERFTGAHRHRNLRVSERGALESF